MALWETCQLRLRDADDHGGCSAVYEHIYNSGSVSLQKKSVDGEGSAAPLRWTSKYLNFPVRAIVCTWDAEGHRDVRISRVLCYAPHSVQPFKNDLVCCFDRGTQHLLKLLHIFERWGIPGSNQFDIHRLC